MPRHLAPRAFMRVLCSHRRRGDALRGVRDGTGHHRGGSHQRRVVNAAGQPVEGVRVCALDTASCATSDARGAFRIGELRAGAYRLEILPLEGLPFTSDPVNVRAGLDGTVDVTLPRVENFQQTVTVSSSRCR